MNRYIAALAIGIGLMAHSPALAEVFKFGPRNDAPMKECLEAADEGLELTKHDEHFNHGEQRFLIKDIKMGTSWRVYEIYMSQGGGSFSLNCTYRSLKSRTT